MSKKALEKFASKLVHQEDVCRQGNEGSEDLEMGSCLRNSTIYIDDRDEMKQKRFFPVGILEHLKKKNRNNSFWYDKMMYYDAKFGNLDCCSDTIVNLHYVKPPYMYLYQYLIYDVHPFGLDKNLTEVLPRKLSMEEILSASDVESNATDFHNQVVYHNMDESEKFRRK